ncbi:MAG: nucleotidyltransferase family protein [Rhodoferax sp.]
MVLAAGRGERMRPLTDTCPKPLLQVQGRPLLAWHLQALAQAGCPRAVLNTAWLGEQISAALGDVFASQIGTQPASDNDSLLSNSEQFGLHCLALQYSHEGRDFGGALETAGGIARALPLLCPQPTAAGGDLFWVLAGDVFAPDFVFDTGAVQRFAASTDLAHLWLVPNPAHHPGGDFGLEQGRALNLAPGAPGPRYTYSTIGLYRAALFAPPWCGIAPGNPQGVKAPLGALLRHAMDNGRVGASLYTGRWTDVGTPERLAALNA